MRVTCPACAATYDVPDRMIGAGRRLRCAKCGHDWLFHPEGPAVEEEAAAAQPRTEPPSPAPSATTPPAPDLPSRDLPPRRAASPRRPQLIDPPLPPLGDAPPRHDGVLKLAWIVTGLVVLGLVAALYLFRTEIVEAWPPAARLYLALGLDT